MTRRKIVAAVSACVLVLVAFLAFGSKLTPGPSLAPAIFVSYDEYGNESRILFRVSEDGFTTRVTVHDDENYGKAWGRWLSDCPFEYKPVEQTVVFADRTWVLSGETGSRRLENVDAEGDELWGTYYEDVDEALKAEPYRYSR